ncbi:MAG TPA: hypothetical protein VLB09_00295 [Nitrospiria bacterium]|nr:hypothetical protein [Nitrospiria bacterium]
MRSAGILRFHPHEAVTIPTSEGIDAAAAVSTGDICKEITIGD